MLKAELVQDGKQTLVILSGAIDEATNNALRDIYTKAEKTVVFDFKLVEYVNSLGIRSWINFLRNIEEGRMIQFRNCTPDVVMQMNLISHFKGTATVTSFYGEYSCEDCGDEELILFQIGDNNALSEQLTEQSCQTCGGNLLLDEDEENYLQFLED